MENMKSDFDLHIQKSFSFTAFSKFKESSLEFFSDDDEDLNDNNSQKNDDNNSFIEISLDHNHNNNPSNDNNNSHLRISFSSSFPSIPETRPANQRAGPEPPTLAPGLRSSSTGAFNPLVHTLLFSLEAHPSPGPAPTGFDGRDWKGSDVTNRDHPLQLAMINNADVNVHNHRKASNITTTTTTTNTTTGNRNGIMKKLLMIKFRATKVKKLISSLFSKSRGQVNVCNSSSVQNDMSHGKKSKKRQQNPKETLDHQHHQYYDKLSHVNDNKNPSCGGYKPRALEVNLGAVRGVLEAVNLGNSATKSNDRANRRKTSSCPSSMKSSPIHQGFGGADCNNNGTFFCRENSILAAIAHCKSSLGQSTDFQF